MKRSLFILSVVCGMCCMSFCSCRFGQSDGDEDGEKDSIGVDSLGLEELDLYEEVVIPKTADEVFDDFLFSYISNASFSQERTVGSVNELAMNDDDDNAKLSTLNFMSVRTTWCCRKIRRCRR